ncbi:DeoR/GlpR family DNA-binding transcription regulator [Propionivibrio dicarboxylicus]|uniref:Transcriptional regulator, DeoR family n=1 Tax=Propionivibrio dicarboxylicus TaxID=83767 RepID=A0A1G8ETF6_9RHOO|nr:DeoR/GlpR family DNA-binding transcription regulator [Propionivibrio dicarboxylicus]SDH73134.1 transcriptional regulator, DeoR family [Propionivibrio dicarboxylicus]
MNVNLSPETLRYRDAHARRAAIIDQLRATGFVTIGELAALLGVSEMTIRRDAQRLHEKGQAIALRGALRLPMPETSTDPTVSEYQRRAAAARSAKTVVGQLAAKDIQPNDVIAIDAGTTAMQVAKALPEDFSGSVVTHSIPVINHLFELPLAKTIVLGGDLYRPSRAFVGSVTVDNAKRLRVRTFYMGAAAVDDRGIYTSVDVERLVKQTLMEIADRVVLVIDHRKFDVTAPVFLCGWDRLSAVVSDHEPPPSISAFLKQQCVQLLIPLQPQTCSVNHAASP